MEQELKKEEYKVVKHNDLVNEKPDQPYTLNQLKLICHLISHIKPTDTNFETKEVLLSELGFDSIDSYNYSRFKSEILELLKKPFELPTKYWVNWFSTLSYKEGVIEYAFDERLKPYLLNLKNNFTSYQLRAQGFRPAPVPRAPGLRWPAGTPSATAPRPARLAVRGGPPGLQAWLQRAWRGPQSAGFWLQLAVPGPMCAWAAAMAVRRRWPAQPWQAASGYWRCDESRWAFPPCGAVSRGCQDKGKRAMKGEAPAARITARGQGWCGAGGLQVSRQWLRAR